MSIESPATVRRYRVARPISPRRRPPPALRAVAGLLGAGMLLANGALLLSDRAPGVLRRIFGDVARRLSDRIDAGGRLGVRPGGGGPQNDFFVHVGLWALAIVFVGLAIWTWRGLAVGALAVFACSIVVEVAQGRYSQSRTVEWPDVAANATGVAIGAMAVALGYLLWSSLAEVHDRYRRATR